MKRYFNKILPVMILLIVFVVAINTNIPNSIGSYVRTLANVGKNAGSCDSGQGDTYYIKADSLTIRSEATMDSTALGYLQKCTQVKVYCTTGSWGKISKTSEKWINTGKKYASTDLPPECGGEVTTTVPDPISFTLGNPTYTYAPDMDKMYADRNGKVDFKVTKIKNVAVDEENLFSIKIKQGNNDVTGNFNITKKLNGNELAITIEMVDAEENPFAVGSYSVVVSARNYSDTKDFKIVGKYYNFVGSYEKISNRKNNPTNKENKWQVYFNNLIGIDMSKFTYNITKVGETNGANYNNNFNVSRNSDGYEVKNNTWFWNRPSPGTYRITFTYSNPSYSDARGPLTYSFDITLGGRDITFNNPVIESHRYIRTKDNVPYTIELVKKTSTNITYIENGTTYTKTLAEFAKIYTDLDTSNLTLTSTGNIAYRHDETCTIVKKLYGDITYHADNGTNITMLESEFKTKFPEAYAALTSGIYTFDSNGNLRKKSSGTKVVENKRLSPKNQTIFAATGGEFNITYDYAELDDDDFNKTSYKIYREDGSTVGTNEGFSFSWTHDDNKVYIKIIYDNIDEKYTGNYYVRLSFKDAGTVDVPFSLYDGEIDFYLTSQVDGHLETSNPLPGSFPPGNQRYEYYLGFFLIKGGKVQTTKNAKMIQTSIYDHRADLDSDGNIYFYDQIDYDVKINKFINNNVTYSVSEMGSDYVTKTSTLAEFTQKYKHAASLINKYTYDAAGNLVGDNYPLHIKSFVNNEALGDMVVTYVEGTTTKSMPLAEFKVTYPEMYAYLVTRFVFDESGNIVLGSILGNYRVTEYGGVPIVGKEVTDQFNITVDNSSENIEKAVTVLPKTEVDFGTYYVYVAYDNKIGVGFVNDADDAVIDKEQYPEMWEQNIHMTTITYDKPIYSANIKEPILSNVGNDSPKIYNNIEGSARFDIDVKDIFNYDGFSYKVEYFNGTSYVDAKSHFKIVNTLDVNSEDFDTEDPHFLLTTNVGVAKSGKYRLTLNYTNKGEACTSQREFNISGKYYGLILDETEEIRYIHNYSEEKNIMAKGHFVNNPNNVVPSITRLVEGGNNEELTHNAANKTFTNSLGEVVFKYTVLIDNDYYGEPNTLLYQFNLTNVGNVTAIGNYVLTFTYQEGSEDPAVSTKDFYVDEDDYFFELKNEYPRATETEMTLSMDINTKFINYEDLDEFVYTVYYYDKNARNYVDVSSTTSSNRMFVVTDTWDKATAPDYQGKVTLTINQNRVDLDGDYYIHVKFRKVEDEFNISNLRELFEWDVYDFTINGIYHETIIDDDGNQIDNPIKVDKFYSNLEDTSLDILLKSVHENNVNWTINKDCLNDSCDPTTGTNYNDRFEEVNTTGKDKKLKLSVKKGLSADERLKPGTYALVLYYSSTDYRVVELVVYSEYVDIEFDEYLIYSDITADKVVDGLYSNKDGHLYIPVAVRGVPYSDVDIKITDANGDGDYSTSFIYDVIKFENEHALDIKYMKNTAIPNNYLVTVSYDTQEGLVYDSLDFTLNGKYFNFYFNKPIYNPDPLIPNAEDGGKVTYVIDTEDIPNITMGENNIDELSKKHVFAKNTRIVDINNNDVTDSFKITATNNADKTSSFDLNLAFAKNAIKPGFYKVTTHYEMEGYIKTKSADFIVGEYDKTFDLSRVEIITNSKDGKLHKNIPGIVRLSYFSEYNILKGGIKVKVTDELDNDVTNHFRTEVTDDYIDVNYLANTPFLNAGTYKIFVTYHDLDTGKVVTKIEEVVMYGEYKEINITNMYTTSSRVYADKDGQFYTFDVEMNALTDTDIKNLKAKITNSNGELVYSDIPEDKVTNQFGVINNLKTTDKNYRINILGFKSVPDEYTIKLYLENEDGEYNISNELKFKVDAYYYRVALSNDSFIKQKENYNPADTTSIYDIDGGVGEFKFTSNYPNRDNYSIKIMQGINVIKEIKNPAITEFDDEGLIFLVANFETGALTYGKYDVALCINGLPYVKREMEVVPYIPVEKVTMIIDGKEVGSDLKMYMGQTRTAKFKIEPSNATNVKFTYTSDDEGVATFKDGYITITGVGSTKITLANKDISIFANLTTEQRITSMKYDIDYENNIIFVSFMDKFTLTKDEFMDNLDGVLSTYKILNANGDDATTTINIGTGMELVSGSEKYKIVVIGDLTGDGNIKVNDVSMLFQFIRGKYSITDQYKLQAAEVRKAGRPSVADVAKLYQFLRGKINNL